MGEHRRKQPDCIPVRSAGLQHTDSSCEEQVGDARRVLRDGTHSAYYTGKTHTAYELRVV